MSGQVVVDAGKLLADVEVRVAQHADALPGEIGRAFGVVSLLRGMAVAIDLEDELQLGAVEVGDIGPDRLLAQELVAVELAVAQELLPEGGFGGSGGLAIGAGECCQFWVVGEVFGAR